MPSSLIAEQARSLGIPLLQDSTHPDDYETVFLRVLDRLRGEGIDGIVFGNIHLADIRAWYEERVRGRGLSHVEPLWGDGPSALVREFVERSYVAYVVSIDMARTPGDWLGRPVDSAFVDDLAAHPEIDPCGERGEYHTFVVDGPLFHEPIDVEFGKRVEMEGHALIDLTARGTDLSGRARPYPLPGAPEPPATRG